MCVSGWKCKRECGWLCLCVYINTAGYKKIIMCCRNTANNGAIISFLLFLVYCRAGCAYPRVEKLFQGCSPNNALLQTETIGICQSSSLWACWPYVESSICQEMSWCTVGLPDVQVVSLLLRGEEKKSSWMSDGVSEGGGDKCVCDCTLLRIS